MNAIPNAIIRAVRTYLQVLIGLFIASWVDVTDLASFIDIGEAALLASVPAALSLIQNLLEDESGANIPK